MTKRLIYILISFALSVTALAAPPKANESLSYKVMYKWGLINKQAGRATITIHDAGDHYKAKLVARSESWADKFFCVRDTLNGTISKNGFRPLTYEKIAHEGSDHKHDYVRFEYNGSTVTGYTSRKVRKDKELKVDQDQVLTATGPVVDMLSSFYYMRSLPFEQWQVGHGHSLTIFSGKRKETLTLKYKGKVSIKENGKVYECYHITFIFTSDGGKKTSDDMDAWITTDSSRVAVKLEGKLPVGKVRCLLTGK